METELGKERNNEDGIETARLRLEFSLSASRRRRRPSCSRSEGQGRACGAGENKLDTSLACKEKTKRETEEDVRMAYVSNEPVSLLVSMFSISHMSSYPLN